MLKLELNLPEIRKTLQELPTNREKLFEMMRFDAREMASKYLNQLMNMELSFFLGRDKYQRSLIDFSERNYRNGFYSRTFAVKGLGKLKVVVLRDRLGEYETSVLPKFQQYDAQIQQDMVLMFLSGISTRGVGLISERLLGRKLSHGEASNANQELKESIEKWRNRDLSTFQIKYMILDGVNFDMRISDSVEKVSVLVAIGVTLEGQRIVLGFQAGDKESATSWREFLKDLKRRGLSTHNVVLGIMDGLSGLETVFKDEFPKADIQRCQVHVARNVISKVPRKLKQKVADELRNIFYAGSKQKAQTKYQEFIKKWETQIPSACRSLKNSIDRCLTFYKRPQEEWISIRTTNMIERLNKEFKRRTKPMEIVAGEQACYMLLAFISLKMEMSWRQTPVGKSPARQPWFIEFTQKT